MSKTELRSSSSYRSGRTDGRHETVAEMQNGQTGVIETVDGAARAELSAMGIRPGARVEVHSKQPLNGPVVISIGPSMTSLSRRYAKQITVVSEE